MKKRGRLTRARLDKGWSQAYAAEQVDVNPVTFSRWERGISDPYPVHIAKMKDLFELSAEELDLVESEGVGQEIMTRRDALFAIPGAFLAIEELMRSSEALAQCAIGVPSLWNLYFSGKIEDVTAILPMYKSYVTALVLQPSVLQNHAFGLASQVHQLVAEIATDQEDQNAAMIASQEALLYAQSAKDANLMVASLMRQANIFFHRKMSTKALQTYQQAIPIMTQASPLLQARIHIGLAEVHGMRSERQEALRSIGLAHEIFPAQPILDTAFGYTHINEYELDVFGRCQTHLYLGQPKQAVEGLDHITQVMGEQIDPLPAVDLLYYRGEAASMMGDLEAATKYVEDGAILAKRINSQLYFGKIAATYRDMSQRWANDGRVAVLAELFQSW
ncbi:helix-turn-helix domain-containing protein [Ktedonobacter racemifer]|uniref:Transcriptional regulator, XRE family n=1 Tax=Ktedonobacter racemifer DSM 44963 TaxID=485913 RepID=D6U3X9_KTERA|nr:helix-turn-helix transcriptional regulator [Ktedonobacter racemifer]EFH81217.1 transcriptional regulator, XRE family [Ktedonobacter racemifer DSM 44963]